MKNIFNTLGQQGAAALKEFFENWQHVFTNISLPLTDWSAVKRMLLKAVGYFILVCFLRQCLTGGSEPRDPHDFAFWVQGL